jgi:succinate dehydrogenase/fumarate reductase iron-sulfur protein
MYLLNVNKNIKFRFKHLNLFLNKNINFKIDINKVKNFIFTDTYLSIFILKYDPFLNNIPWIQSWFLSRNSIYPMMLDNLFLLKNINDESLSFRRSCREGICGSCAMNINGINTLACIKDLNIEFKKKYFIFPLPHMPIIKDVVVCMNHFYKQYKSINPFLSVKRILTMNTSRIFNEYKNSVEIYIINSTIENFQSKDERSLLDGLYECILCACCSTSCPSYWWNKDRYLGPAVLLQAFRWLIDSRDDSLINRLYGLDDEYKLYRCHTILNCVQTCPKNLSPANAISNIKSLIRLKEY